MDLPKIPDMYFGQFLWFPQADIAALCAENLNHGEKLKFSSCPRAASPPGPNAPSSDDAGQSGLR